MKIEQVLEGLRYPAAKEQVIAHARQHDAPLNVLHVLDQLPAGEWQSTIDLMKSIGSVNLRGPGAP